MSLNYEFDWDDVAILDKENFLGKRLISEMLHIKRKIIVLIYKHYLHHACVAILNKL